MNLLEAMKELRKWECLHKEMVEMLLNKDDILYEAEKELERYQKRCKLLEERLAKIREAAC